MRISIVIIIQIYTRVRIIFDLDNAQSTCYWRSLKVSLFKFCDSCLPFCWNPITIHTGKFTPSCFLNWKLHKFCDFTSSKKTILSTYWSFVGILLKICVQNIACCGKLAVFCGTYHSIALVLIFLALVALSLFKTELSLFPVNFNLYPKPNLAFSWCSRKPKRSFK